MLPVEPVGYPALGIHQVQHFVGIQLLAGSEDYYLEDPRHFEEEGLQPEPLYCVYFGALPVEHHLSYRICTSDS